MNDVHDPLTCPKCSPAPWAHLEYKSHGRTRQYTGWAAVAFLLGPFVAVAFMVGVLAGVLLAVAVR